MSVSPSVSVPTSELSVSPRKTPPLIGGVKLVQGPSIRPMRYLFIKRNAMVEWYLWRDDISLDVFRGPDSTET